MSRSSRRWRGDIEFRFLVGRRFCRVPRERAERTRRIDLRQPRSYYFFHALSERGIARRGQRREEEKKRRPGRRLSSTFLRLYFTRLFSSSLPLLLFTSSSLRDLIRCRKRRDAEEAQFTQLAKRGYLIICWLFNDETPLGDVSLLFFLLLYFILAFPAWTICE